MFVIGLHCTVSISYVMDLIVYDVCYNGRHGMLC